MGTPQKGLTGGRRLDASAIFRRYTHVLRHRNYRLYISGQFLTQIGTWVQMVGQMWLVYRLSHSSKMLGLVGFAEQIPILLLSPIAGVIADRVDRRRFILFTQHLAMLQAVILSVLTLTNLIQIWQIFALSLSLGLITTFNGAARQAFIIEMVPREELVNAIALNSTCYNSGRIIGSSLAGVLVGLVGEGYCFLINAIGFIATIVALWMLRLPPAQLPKEKKSAFQALRKGFDYVWGYAPVRSLFMLLGLTAVFNYSFHQVLMPIFADQVLHGGPKALGSLLGSLGAGVIVGAAYMSGLDPKKLGQLITSSTIACSLLLIAFGFSRNLRLSMGLLFFVGTCLMFSINGMNAAIQTITPDSLRGRVVGGFYLLAFVGMSPIGYLIGGWLGNLIGPRWTVTVGALICIAAVQVFDHHRPLLQKAILQAIGDGAEKSSGSVEPLTETV